MKNAAIINFRENKSFKKWKLVIKTLLFFVVDKFTELCYCKHLI